MIGFICAIIGAACFGSWVDNANAGWFMFFVLIALNGIDESLCERSRRRTP